MDKIEVLQLATDSFGLIVPSDLHDVHPFDVMDLRNDSLVRVDTVCAADNTITFSDCNRDQTIVYAADLKQHYVALLPQWVGLVKTLQVYTLKEITSKI